MPSAFYVTNAIALLMFRTSARILVQYLHKIVTQGAVRFGLPVTRHLQPAASMTPRWRSTGSASKWSAASSCPAWSYTSRRMWLPSSLSSSGDSSVMGSMRAMAR
jgi:hypothetical protein